MIARGMAIFGPPIVLGMIFWIMHGLVDLGGRVTSIETGRQEARIAVFRRLDDVEGQLRRDMENERAFLQRLSSLEASMHATRSGVERIERVLDSQRR